MDYLQERALRQRIEKLLQDGNPRIEDLNDVIAQCADIPDDEDTEDSKTTEVSLAALRDRCIEKRNGIVYARAEKVLGSDTATLDEIEDMIALLSSIGGDDRIAELLSKCTALYHSRIYEPALAAYNRHAKDRELNCRIVELDRIPDYAPAVELKEKILAYMARRKERNRKLSKILIPVSASFVGVMVILTIFAAVFKPKLIYTMTEDGYVLTKNHVNKAELTIPAEYKGLPVTTVGEGAFRGNTKIVSVTIPDTVGEIASECFYGCDSLTVLRISNTLKSIGERSFGECNALTTIFYEGTESDWRQTSISPEGNEALTQATVYFYSEEQPDVEGNLWHYDTEGAPAIWTEIHIHVYDREEVIAPADCLNSGERHWVCVCGRFTTETIEALGHDMVDHEAKSETCTDVGWNAYIACSRCDYTTCVEIPALGHDEIAHEALPACTKIGWDAYVTCTRCDYTTYVELNKAGHVDDDDDYLCDRCSISLKGTEGIEYTYDSSTDEYLVTGYSGSATDVYIPPYYNKKQVRGISDSAFKNKGITSVTIGDGITFIREYAFSGCSYLTSLTIPDSVTSIGGYAFNGCSSLTSVTIPDSVTSIGGYAFNGCSSLTSATIGSSVTSIGDHAFYNCSGLTSVTIPDSVTSIGYEAFMNCSGLTLIKVGANNSKYYTGGNCLIETATNKLILGCQNSIIPISVTSIGEYAFYGCRGLTSVTIPDFVTKIGKYAFYGCSDLTLVTIGNSVTSIGDSAFSRCSGLTSITIPDSVTSIGSEAFENCNGLTSITIPFVGAVAGKTSSDTFQYPFGYIFGYGIYADGTAVTQYYYGYSTSSTTNTTYRIPSALKTVTVTGGNILFGAFYGCRGLTSVTISDSVTSIGGEAFRGCSGLTSVTIPDSVTSIGGSAFDGCTGLTSITIPDSATSIGSSAFSGCSGLTSVTIGDSVTSIGDSAFYNCSGLTTITIPDSVTSIGSSAFSGCSGLTSVIIGNSVTNIGEYAFKGCSGLTSLTIPDSVTSIGNSAFYDCSSLTSVTIGNSVRGIGSSAFYGCSGLTSITIPDSVTSIGGGAFYGCSGLTSVTIPDSVTSIGGGAFRGCSGLTSIIISDSVTSIGDDAFWGCTGLTSVTIPDSVTSIGKYAFRGCSGLTSLTIPDSVTSIGREAFRGCIRLTSIYFNGTKVHWDAISKGSSWDYYTVNYTIYCTDGEINKS